MFFAYSSSSSFELGCAEEGYISRPPHTGTQAQLSLAIAICTQDYVYTSISIARGEITVCDKCWPLPSLEVPQGDNVGLIVGAGLAVATLRMRARILWS